MDPPFDAPGPEETHEDPLIMVPQELISSPDEEAPDVGPSASRRHVARGFADLMGGEMDANGPAADVIDAGDELILWAVSPNSDAVAVTPDIHDWTDPQAWLGALQKMDLPADLESAIERLARSAEAKKKGVGDAASRREFSRQLGDLLRSVGLDALAVRRKDGGYDWIALNAQDLAHERDGEPWAPPGGYHDDSDGHDLKRLGVSLGMGGTVSLWPSMAAPPQAAPGDAEGAQPPAARAPRNGDRRQERARP